MGELPVAQEITLHKTKPLAPPFHQHIAKRKLIGNTCQIGDQVLVYQVTDSIPKGLVAVTESTIIHFE